MLLFLGLTKIGKSVTYIGTSTIIRDSDKKFSLKETFPCLYPIDVSSNDRLKIGIRMNWSTFF